MPWAAWIRGAFLAGVVGLASVPAEAPAESVDVLPRVGTAFVVAPDLLLTAYHAVTNHDRLFVSTERDGLFTAGRLVAFDEALDIALIEAAVDADPVVFGAWESVPIGVEVSVVGFPKIGQVVTGKRITAGIINGEQRFSGRDDWFQLSAEVHRGNSGSPVLTPDGHIVGIISHKLDARRASELTFDFPQNVNFALKSARIADFLDDQDVDYEVAMFDGTSGLEPHEIYRDVTDAVHLLVVTRPGQEETDLPSP